MNRWQRPQTLSSRVWTWISLLVPVVFFLGLLNGPGLGFAALNQKRRVELASWNDNVYRDSWLDSALVAVRVDRDFLAGIHDKVQRRILPVSLAGESLVDSLRREIQSLGGEVLRLSPTRDSVPHLNRLRIRMEARAGFPVALSWFRGMESRHPEAYVEEVLLRPEARGKLEIHITLLFHSRPAP